MNKNSKIYVAGHNGLVGSAILRNLKANGYNNLLTSTHARLDLTNQQAVHGFFKKEQPEYVFLAAAKVGGILANNIYRAEFIYENLQIQNNVIHCSYLNNVKKILFLGSSCIYPKYAPQPLSEDSLLTGELEYTNEPYAIAKIAGIKMCESYNLQYGTNYIAVMPTNLYGSNDNFDLESSHVIPAIIRKIYLARLLSENNLAAIAKNLNITNDQEFILSELNSYGISLVDGTTCLKLWGSGKPRREFLHVNDMADACIFVMQHVNFKDISCGKKEVRNTHINIGTGSDITIREIAYMIRNILHFTGEVEFNDTKPDGTMQKLQDITKLHNLGWHHKVNLKEGLSEVINWYLSESNQ